MSVRLSMYQKVRATQPRQAPAFRYEPVGEPMLRVEEPPSVGDIVYADGYAWEVTKRAWSSWPHPDSAAARDGDSPLLDVIVRHAQGLFANEFKETADA